MANVTDLSQSHGLLHPSIGHGYRDSEGLQSIHQDVYDAPQVWDPASEGLQSVDHDGRNAPQVVEQSPLSPDLRYAHSGHADYEKTQALVSGQHVTPKQGRVRRRLIWAIMIALSVAIAIAISVGAGVGLTRQSSGSDNDNELQNGSDDTLSSTDSAYNTNSPSGTTSPTASRTTSSIQTSGTTGVAAFSCDDGYSQKSSEGVAYTQECGVYYQTNKDMIAPDPKSWVRNLPIGPGDKSEKPVTTYSFKDCIDHCDEYNSAGRSPGCYGVSYYANLTWANDNWDGNCFMKNGRGVGRSDGDGTEDWGLIASAYLTCLDSEGRNTCPGDD